MPAIHVVPKGSLVAKDLRIVTVAGTEVAPAGVHKLCRCGRSSEKPFCDDSHLKFDWQDGKQDGRVPRQVDEYDGDALTILDDRGVCSHAGICSDNLAAVFRTGKEPWIDAHGADADAIKTIIRQCPSGALSYRVDGNEHDSFHDAAEIVVAPGGPFRVRGGPDLKDPKGEALRSEEHYTLCRCGASKNKPLCDGTHWYVNFGHRGLGPDQQAETDGYIDIGDADAFEEGKPVAVDVDGTALAVFRLWGRVCAVAAEHEGASMVAAEVTPSGKILGADDKPYTPYPWQRADEDDLPVYDVMVVDGKAWVAQEPAE